MKYFNVLIAVVLFSLFGCDIIYKNKGFPEQDLTQIKKNPQLDKSEELRIKVLKNRTDQILSSDLVEEFYYVPLETSDKSLFAYCTDLRIYQNKIFVFDRIGAESLFIFDQNGKFIRAIGDKGGAPFEFYMPKAISIDQMNNRIVVYDNQKRKWMYFSLNGDFEKSVNVNFRMKCSSQVLPSGNIVSVINKSDRNDHLGEYDHYRLVYTDSTGTIIRADYSYPETVHSSMAYNSLLYNGDELLYFPMYLNQICALTDSTLKSKYIFDYDDYTPFDASVLGNFNSRQEFEDYRSNHTYLSFFSENDTHLYFVTNDKGGERFMTFYDKRSGNMINCTSVYYDMDFAIEFDPIYSYKDYFVALVQPATLKALKDHIQNTTHFPLGSDNNKLFENLKDDDNPVLVFFKVKKI